MGRFTDLLALGSGNGTSAETTTGNTRRESVSRSTGLISGMSGRDRIEAERVPTPTDEIRKYWRMYQSNPIIRASFNQFRDDIMADGYRAEADNEGAETYLDNWSDSAATVTAERDKDIYVVFRDIPTQLLARGTVLLEHSPAEADEDALAGVQFINPATVTPYRASDTNLLLRPDDTQYQGAKLTEDGKAAAYVQFDAGPGSTSDDEKRLTLDEVTRLTIDAEPNDVFGTSRVAPIEERANAIIEKLQNNDRAVETNAFKNWFLGFGHETVKNEDGSETIVEWSDDDMDDVMSDLESVKPGDIEGLDGTVEVTSMGGETADIIDQLKYETAYVLTAMPVPTYSIGFEKDINQFVVDGQEERHEQRIDHFRRMMDRDLRPLARSVVQQGGESPAGARWVFEAPPEDSPVLALSESEMDRLAEYASALSDLTGGRPGTLVPDEVLLEDVLQLEDVSPPERGPEDEADGGLSVEDLADLDGGDVSDFIEQQNE